MHFRTLHYLPQTCRIKITLMKTFTYFLMALFMTISISNSFGHAGKAPSSKWASREITNTTSDSETAYKRLREIYSLARTGNLSKAEKKELRAEVMQIKEQHENEPVLIISGSMLLLIIILLILLV
jgi:hypothetical protein